MGVQRRSVQSSGNTSGTSTNTIIVDKPQGVTDGELMVAITNGPVGTVTAPAGWILLGSFADGSVTQSNMYKKIADGEGANYTFTFPSSSACRVVIISFVGGRDVLLWGAQTSGTDSTPTCWTTPAARDSVGYMVLCWADTASNTVTSNQGLEDFDFNSGNTGLTLYRGYAGYTYGPGITGIVDIVNAGDNLPGTTFTVSGAPTGSIAWQFLVDNHAPDTEHWSSADGDFAVDLELDKVGLDTLGGISTVLRGDITGQVSAVTALGEAAGEEAVNAMDGLASTKWHHAADATWIQYDFGSSVTKTVRRYRVTSGDDNAVEDPMDWTLEGSNNGTDFTVLDTRENESFAARGETNEFRVTDPGAYRYYRLDISSNRFPAGAAGTSLAEWRLSDIDVWEDVTEYVTHESKIRITRGLQGSSGRSDFSRAYAEFNNTDGRFSIGNQDGRYYGAIQRNTQMRVSKAYGTKALQLQGEVRIEGTTSDASIIGDCVRTALTGDQQITGDIDVRIDLHPESWRDEQVLCGVAYPENAHEGWSLFMDSSGVLHLTWDSGSAFFDVSSEFAVPQGGRQAVRATLDVNDGASGHVVTFYTSDSISGSWTQLGDAVTGSGTTSISYSGGALSVGHVQGRTERGIHGLVHHFELRDGIGGTLVADADFTSVTNGAHAFTEGDNNWLTINNSVVSNRRWRFHGEVAEWPVAWDPTGTWISVSATGAGVQKRLERSPDPLSVMRRYHTKAIIENPGAFERYATPHAYWPMEDGKGAFRLASGLPSKPGMEVYGLPQWENSDGETFPESGPLIRMSGAKFGGRVVGAQDGYADIRWIHYSPTDMSAGASVMEIYTTGPTRRWEVTYEASNTWRVKAFDENDQGIVWADTGNQTITTNGERMHLRLILDNTSSGADVTLSAVDEHGDSLGSFTDTFLLGDVGRVFRVNVNSDGDISNSYLGHLAVYGQDSPAFGGSEVGGHQYETAGRRVERLCQEEQLGFRYIGSLDDSSFMGVQGIDSPFPLMSSSAVSGEMFLVDPLDAFGIELRTLRSMYGQPAHLSVSYTSGELSGDLLPTADDAHLVNDFTANRGDAGGARYRRTDGPLSVNQPPDGVAPYSESQSYSFAHDGQCVDMASWQVHKGTLDEDRYPRVQLALENLRIAADASLTEALLQLDVGDRIDITDPPAFLRQEDIRQVVVGYEEWFDNFQHNFTLNTLPERVYEVAAYDSDDRFAQHGSVLYRDVTAAASTIEVTNEVGLPWSDTADDFDVLIDGERLTVTSVSNVSSSYSTDSFNRADSTTSLGSTDGGTLSAWTQQSGTWGISTNRAYISAAGNSIATIPGSADFEEVSVTAETLAAGQEFWINFRFSDASNRWRWGGTEADDARLEKVVAGAVTSYDADATGNNFVIADGDTLKARCHGSVIEVFLNDRLAMCISDTFNSSASIVGIQTSVTTTRFENFTWISSNPRQSLAVTRGVGASSGKYHKSGAEVKLYQPPYRGL